MINFDSVRVFLDAQLADHFEIPFRKVCFDTDKSNKL